MNGNGREHDTASGTISVLSPDELVIMRFLKELEEASGPGLVIHRYSLLYPHLAVEFEELGAMRARLKPPPVAPPAEARPDRLGDFRIIGEIGRGGMGMIYEAVQEPFQRRVAVKTVRGDLQRVSGSMRARFLREQSVLAKLHHTHIVPIHAAGDANSLHYYAMQYIEGAALNQVITAVRLFESSNPTAETPSMAELAESAEQNREDQRATKTVELVGAEIPATDPIVAGFPADEGFGREQPDGAPPPANGRLRLSTKYLRSVAKVIADAADALEHAHSADVFHRDVKPSNIMVDRKEHCWVLDFGLATLRAGEDGAELRPADQRRIDPIQTSEPLGTPSYMAPEQFDLRFDARSDVWGLGVTLYELLTLRRPFLTKEQILSADPAKPADLIADLPPDLDAICLKAMRKDPDKRYQTAGELRDDLQRWLGHEPTRARPAGLVRRLRLWSRRNPGLACAIALAMIASIATAAAMFRTERHRAEAAEAKAASAILEEKRADAQARASQREALMLRLQRIRFLDHGVNWSADAWDLVRQIQKLGPTNDAKDAAAATLLGIDAKTSKTITFQPDVLAYEPTGKRLLMAIIPPDDPRLLGSPQEEEVRIWESMTDELRPLPQRIHNGYGAITFRDDGTPLQLVWEKQPRSAVLLWDMVGQTAVSRFDLPADVNVLPRAWTITPGGAVAGVLLGKSDSPAANGQVHVWDTASGKVLRKFSATAHDLELAPDGSLLATSGADGNIVLWPTNGGEPVALPSSGRTAITCMAFAQDYLRRAGEKRKGWLLAAGALGGGLTIWDIEKKVPRAYCRGSAHDVHRLAFSSDGMTLASVGRDHPILWDVATGHLILRLGARNWMESLAFSPNGKMLAVGSRSVFGYPGGVDVWALEEARGQEALRGLASPVRQVCVSSSGRCIAALSQDWHLAIWDLETHRLLHVFETPKGVFAGTAGLALNAEGTRLAFATNTLAKLWDVKSGAEIKSWDLPPGFLDRIAFTQQERLVLVRQESVDPRSRPFGPNDGTKTPRVCRVRNLLGPEPARPVVEIKDFPTGAVEIYITPDGQSVIIDGLEIIAGRTGPRKNIKALDSQTGAERWSLPSESTKEYFSVGAIDPTGRFLSIGQYAHSADNLVDIASGRTVRSFKRSPDALGPDARDSFATWHDPEAGDASKRALFRGDAEDPLVTLAGTELTSNAAFSLDGTRLAWGNVDGTVIVCDIQQVRRRLAEVGLGW
jgi:eukaryotic-like serine/threonine-protein kinase